MNRRQLTARFAIACIAASAIPSIAASDYPNNPVKIIVGFSPGGTADSVARILSVSFSTQFSQPFIVENSHLGANGLLATNYVMRAAPDGYTLIFTSIGHVVNPSLYKDKEARYDPVHDFTPIGQVLSAPNVLVVPANSKFNTVQELITYAKENPGKLNFASSGIGASVHLSGELFKQQTGTNIVHIPYKGTGSLMPDLLSGRQISMAFPNLTSALPFIKSGNLKALGVTTAQRSPSAPGIPTLSEAGVPGYAVSTWYGLLGPANMPPDVVQKLNKQLNRIIQDPEIHAKLVALGADPISGTPEAFGSFIEKETTIWTSLLKNVKIQIE